MLDSGYDRQEMILPNRASGYVFTGEAYQNAEFVDLSWPSGAGGMYSTIEDLHKWEQGLHSDTILSESSRAMMFTPKVMIRAAEENAGIFNSYGGIICTHYDRKLLYYGGGINGFSTRIARYPDEQVSIIVLNNVETPAAPLPVVLIANALAAILFDQPYELPRQRQAIVVNPAIYDAYVGQVELFAESPTQFFVKVTEAPCTFVVDETGKASHVILHQAGRDRTATRIRNHIR